MSLQDILINQAVNKVKLNPQNAGSALNSILLSPKIDLNDKSLYLFELCLENLKGEGARKVSDYLYKISVSFRNTHLLVLFSNLLIHWDTSTVYKIIKWNKKLISSKTVLENLKYSTRDSIFFEDVFNGFIASQDKYGLDDLISSLILNSPNQVRNILNHFKNKNINLNLTNTFKAVIDGGFDINLISDSFDALGKITKFDRSLYKHLVLNSNDKIQTSKQFLLLHTNLTDLKYYLEDLAGMITINDLPKLYEYLIEIYQHNFIDKMIISELFDNRNLKVEEIINNIPNQSVYNSILNTIPDFFFSIHDINYIESIFYYLIHSNYFKTCYNKGVISEVYYYIVKLSKNKNTDDLKLTLLSFSDLDKIDISITFWESFSTNSFSEEKAIYILNKLLTYGHEKVMSNQFIAKILFSTNKKYIKNFIKQKMFRFFDQSNTKTTRFLKVIIDNYDYAYSFIKLKKHLLRKGFISKYDEKDLKKIAWRKLSLWQKLKCFFSY